MRLPLCVRIPAEDLVSAGNLEADAWTEVEVLEIYEGKINARMNPAVRAAKPEDCFSCVEIASRAFTHDRLHKDETVRNKDADEFKRRCARECFEDEDTKIRVYELGGIKGFLAIKDSRVMMIAVDPDHGNKGIGKVLINSWHGRLKAGTQSDNEPARRLYESFGMKKTKAFRSFHKWP